MGFIGGSSLRSTPPYGTRKWARPSVDMELTYASLSSPGPVRKNNEDYVGFWEPSEEEQRRTHGAVVVIADGSLSGLNFETLIDPKPAPHYWIEDVCIQNASSLRLLAASLGGVESLVVLPIYSSHYNMSAQELANCGVTPGTVRVSVGLEDADDLIADLMQALA